MAANASLLTEQETRFLRLLPRDGSAIHVLQPAAQLGISLNDSRSIAAGLADRSYVNFFDDMVSLAPAGSALLLH